MSIAFGKEDVGAESQEADETESDPVAQVLGRVVKIKRKRSRHVKIPL
jgi:hypothetical protein